MKNKVIKFATVALGTTFFFAPGFSDTIVSTKDGRTFTLPIELSDIQSIKETPTLNTRDPNPASSRTKTDATLTKPRLPAASVLKDGAIPARNNKNIGNTLPGSGQKTDVDVGTRGQSTSNNPRSAAAPTGAKTKPTASRAPRRPVDTPKGFASFEERCTAPSVVFCDPLDTEGPWGVDAKGKRHLLANTDGTHGIPKSSWWERWRGVANGTLKKTKGAVLPGLDSKVKASGTGSLRFVQPSLSGASGAGAFATNFSEDLSQTFGEGDTFFVQYRWRASCELLYFDCDPKSPNFKETRRFYAKSGKGKTAFKLSIIGTGDPEEGKSANSCTALEMVLVHGSDHSISGYHNCGWYKGFSRKVDPATSPIPAPNYAYDSQPGGIFTCPSNYGKPEVKKKWGRIPDTCFTLDSDQWMTIQMQISIGTWQPRRSGPDKNIPPNSNVKLWAAYEGEPQQLVIDNDLYLKGSKQQDERFGKVWLFPYMTKKDNTETHPAAQVWYDELIVSRAFIANPK